jgi:hypothetical protein
MKNEILIHLQDALIQMGDRETVLGRIHKADDISRNFTLLSNSALSDEIIEYLISLFVEALRAKIRFQRKKALIVIKRLITRRPGDAPFSRHAIDQLVYVFKEYVFDPNHAIQWAATTVLKNQPLDADQLQWMMANCDRSPHPLNRLLRHPTVPRPLADWAQDCIRSGKYKDRFAELLALTITDQALISALSAKYGGEPVIWAIFYARQPPKIKHSLLYKMMLVPDLAGHYAEVCKRLGFGDLLQDQVQQLAVE